MVNLVLRIPICACAFGGHVNRFFCLFSCCRYHVVCPSLFSFHFRILVVIEGADVESFKL